MVPPPLEAGGLNSTLAWALPAVATGLVGASGTAKLAWPPIRLVHAVPLLICNSPEEPQFVHQTISPAAGVTMAFRWTLVIRGGKNPCVVELASNTAEALAAEDAPTITFPFTVALVKVPTVVRLEFVTVAFNVFPVSVPAAAGTVMSALPLNATPLMFLGVAKVVAVAALPVVEPELPVTLPTMGLVTVRFVSVPTLVRLEPVTVALRLVPVKVPAAAAGMFALTT